MNNFKTFKEFLEYVENNYEEEEQLIIEDLMSYYINEYRGFGRFNCLYTYKENIEKDKTGELHRLSLLGFQFEKKREDDRNKSKQK